MCSSDLDSVLDDKDKVIKAEEAEAGPGDGKFFTIKTDDNITTLEVGDVYRNEQKTFFKVTGIQSKGTQGGEFSVQRTAGKSEPDRKFQRVSGAGPVTIVASATGRSARNVSRRTSDRSGVAALTSRGPRGRGGSCHRT